MNTWAIIVAGGSGTRMGMQKNKVLLNISGKSVLSTCVSKFLGLVNGIILVVRPDDEAEIKSDLIRNNINNVFITYGGSTRQGSVNNGLKLVPANADVILVHDAARPFVNDNIINNVINEAYNNGAAIAAYPVFDTLKRANDNIVQTTIDRSNVYSIQTPQGFKKDILIKAYDYAKENNIEGTDDSSLVEKIGVEVKIVMGSKDNIKITTVDDLPKETSLDIRIGFGYDVHKLVEGRKLILCGVEVPYNKGLLGHSDADVATHALIDAILGAAAMGDIGKIFPDTDAKYKDANSINLLKTVVAMLKNKNYKLKQADITIIAQLPKLSPFIDNMVNNLENVLEVKKGSINVKATTTEKLGFCGRGEGIAANAVCTIVNI